MSIREIDSLSAAGQPEATVSEASGGTAVAPTWTLIEPGKPVVMVAPRNQSETDLEIGSARLAALHPFALSALGRSYLVWDAVTGRQIERTDPLSLKTHVKELAKKLGCGVDFIYKCVRHICDVGPENVRVKSLLKVAPDGGKNGCRLRSNNADVFWSAIEDVCVSRGLRPGTKKAINEISTYLAANGWVGKLPSDKSLRKHSKSARVMSARTDAYDRDHLLRVIGKPSESLGLMSVAQLDATLFTYNDKDALLVVNEQGHSMGPANVIFGLLGANRGVWTFLSFVGAANSYLAGLSIKRGVLSKDTLLQQYGIRGVWPYSGKVGQVLHDNGSEFIAEHLGRVLDDLDIGFDESAPAKTPHFRGKNERFNRTAHKLFKEFLSSGPGTRYLRTVHGNKEAKGILLTDLDRALMEWIVCDYHSAGHKGLGGDSPNSRFEKMVEGSHGLPASGLVPALADTNELDWDFMCEEMRVVNHLGISWANRFYRSPELQKLFALNKRSSIRRIPFRYNPYGIGAVYVKVPDGQGGEKIIKVPWIPDLEKYPMTEDELRIATNPSLWEWDLLYAALRRAGHANPTSGLIADLHHKRESEAASNRKSGAPKRAARITDARNRGMRENLGQANLPATASEAPPPSPPVPRKSYCPAYLPVAGGHDAY